MMKTSESDVHLSGRRRLLLGVLAGSSMLPVLRAFAHEGAMGDMPGMGEMPEHHHHGEAPQGVKRSQASYGIPALRQVRQDGSVAEFPHEIEAGRPVLLNFIYTSCTTICPVTTQVFSEVQEKLAGEHAALDLVSISIDPEYDTPARLSQYAKKFGAKEHWHFYTGTQAASIAMQKAFNVYRGDKMNHEPVTFLRGASGKPWVRLDGFVSAAQLVQEYRALGQGS